MPVGLITVSPFRRDTISILFLLMLPTEIIDQSSIVSISLPELTNTDATLAQDEIIHDGRKNVYMRQSGANGLFQDSVPEKPTVKKLWDGF